LRIELDEAWSFVAKKQRHLKPGGSRRDFGDQYVFLALAGAGKAIIFYRVGKRTGEKLPHLSCRSSRPRAPRTGDLVRCISGLSGCHRTALGAECGFPQSRSE
jgi:hypothetical protein